MPRFFFDVHDGSSQIDDEGTVLPDLAAARIEAAKMAGTLLSDHADAFWSGDRWTIEVRDEAGQPLFSLVFTAVEGATPLSKRRDPAS